MRVVDVTDVHKTRGARQALAGINLTVSGGEVLTVVGPNGAGKSTLIEILEGSVLPDRGRVEVLGENPAAFTAATRARVGVFLQPPGIPARLTVAEALGLFALCYPNPRSTEDLLERFRLASLRRVQVRYLSQGQRLRVSLALAFVRTFDILFLDEPMAHIDPEGRGALWEEIGRARDAGAAVVCSTHLVDEAYTRSDRLLVLGAGRVVALAAPTQLMAPYTGLTRLELTSCDGCLRTSLEAVPGVARVRYQRDKLVLHCRDAARVMAALAPHARVHPLSAGPVSLEDVVRLLTEEDH